ncbi:MAG: hypothetical protein ABFD16_30050 [Thermoguttaceae bacterium]|jgi:hypothetical protein
MDHIGERGYASAAVGMEQPAPRPFDDLVNYLRDYARERPDVVALWAFGLGFLLGWRLKPW